ncbi:MAG: hypothetical protein IJZ93_05645 [Clostridia bacterium]|nr:hypothetical protein [Clostridia bacterium]
MKKKLLALLLVVITALSLVSCSVIPEANEVFENLKDENYIVTPIMSASEEQLEEVYGTSFYGDAVNFFEAIDEDGERVVFIEFESSRIAEAFIENAKDTLRGTFRVFAGNGTRTIMATSDDAYEDAIG